MIFFADRASTVASVSFSRCHVSVRGQFARLGKEVLSCCFKRKGPSRASQGPINFSLSFYLVQVAHQTLTAQALLDTAHILDKQPVPDITRRAALLKNANNSNHICVDVSKVESNLVAHSTLVNRHGFATHESVKAGKHRTLLGVRCDGELGIAAPAPERDALLDQSLVALLNGSQQTACGECSATSRCDAFWDGSFSQCITTHAYSSATLAHGIALSGESCFTSCDCCERLLSSPLPTHTHTPFCAVRTWPTLLFCDACLMENGVVLALLG